MANRTYFIVALTLLVLFGAGLVYLRYSNISIGADQTVSSQNPTCQVKISGKITLTHIEKNDSLKLELVDGNAVLAEAVPTEGAYSFSLANHIPSDYLNIIALETLSGQILEYQVADLNGIECGSVNNLDLVL